MHRAAGMGLAVEQSPWEALVLDTAGSLENRLLVYCPNGACSLGIECRSKDKLSLGPSVLRRAEPWSVLGGYTRGHSTEDNTGQQGPDSPGRAPRACGLIQPHLTQEETWATWDRNVGGRADSQCPASCPDLGCWLQAHAGQESPRRSLVLESGTLGFWRCPLGLSFSKRKRINLDWQLIKLACPFSV